VVGSRPFCRLTLNGSPVLTREELRKLCGRGRTLAEIVAAIQ